MGLFHAYSALAGTSDTLLVCSSIGSEFLAKPRRVHIKSLDAVRMQNDEPDENIRQAEHAVRFLWRFILMPLLFTLIGTIINFSTLSSTTIQKACSLVFAGQLPSDGAASVMTPGVAVLASLTKCRVSRRGPASCAGLGVRMVTTFLVMKTSHFAWLECIWFAIAWTPKVPAGCLPCTCICGLRSCSNLGIQLSIFIMRCFGPGGLRL